MVILRLQSVQRTMAFASSTQAQLTLAFHFKSAQLVLIKSVIHAPSLNVGHIPAEVAWLFIIYYKQTA